MDRLLLIKKTNRYLKKLPSEKLIEVHDFVEYLYSKCDQYVLREGMSYLSSKSGSLDFLNDEEEDVYTISDVKEEYK